MNVQETYPAPARQEHETSKRDPWQKPEVEVLAIDQTREGNTTPSSDADIFWS